MSTPSCHTVAQVLGEEFNLSDRQQAVLYKYLQAERVLARTERRLGEARRLVNALRLQECVVRRDKINLRRKLTNLDVSLKAIKRGIERVTQEEKCQA